MAATKQKAKATIKKVAGKLNKASKAHAGQAKALKAIKLKQEYIHSPQKEKLFLTELKQGVRVVTQVNGLHVRHKCLQNNTKQQVVGTSRDLKKTTAKPQRLG